MVLYRGVSAKAIFGDDVKYGYLKSGLVNGDTDADVTAYLSQVKRGTIGKTITDRGYMSTSMYRASFKNITSSASQRVTMPSSHADMPIEYQH